MNFILNWLIQHFLFAGTIFFAAGVDALAAAGGGDGAEADNGADDPGATEDGAGEGAGGEDGSRPASEAANAGADRAPGDKAGARPDQKLDGRQLPAKLREMMTELQASDPKAHGFLKDVLFRDRELAKIAPGGLKEIQTWKQSVDSFKQEFPKGIEGVKAEQAEWKAIDDAFAQGDARVIDIWRDANPEAFNKLMPLAIGKYASIDPDGYQRHMAGIIVSTLQTSGIPQTLNFLNRAIALGDKEGAAELIKSITDWIGAIDQTAKTQPKAPERNTELDQREARLKADEDRVWSERTAAPINAAKSQAIKNELKQYLKDAKGQAIELDDETYEAIEGQALKYLNSLLLADPNFMPTFQRYTEAKDSAGLTQFMKSKLTEFLPSKNGKAGPVEKAYKLFFRGATTAQPKPKPKPNAGPGSTNAGRPAPQGWEKLAKGPAPHEIDMSRSPFEMRIKQAAILKSGKKVYWGAQAPA